MLPDLLLILKTLCMFVQVHLHSYIGTIFYLFVVKSAVASILMQSSCLRLPSVGIIEADRHTWLHRNFIMILIFPCSVKNGTDFSKDYTDYQNTDHFSMDNLAPSVLKSMSIRNFVSLTTFYKFYCRISLKCVCVCLLRQAEHSIQLKMALNSQLPDTSQVLAYRQNLMLHLKSSFNSVLKFVPRYFTQLFQMKLLYFFFRYFTPHLQQHNCLSYIS